MKPHDQPMPESEHAALRSFLQAHGATAAQVQAAIGSAAAGRKRQEIDSALTSWLRARPKG